MLKGQVLKPILVEKKIQLKFLDIKNNRITLEAAKISLKDFSVYLKSIRKGKKSLEQEKTLANINRIFNGRNGAIKFIESYDPKVFESKRLAKQGTGLKILTLKQMPQRLSIALEQVKACNNYETLLNEVRYIAYSLYQSKGITKKVYNNIIKQ